MAADPEGGGSCCVAPKGGVIVKHVGRAVAVRPAYRLNDRASVWSCLQVWADTGHLRFRVLCTRFMCVFCDTIGGAAQVCAHCVLTVIVSRICSEFLTLLGAGPTCAL